MNFFSYVFKKDECRVIILLINEKIKHKKYSYHQMMKKIISKQWGRVSYFLNQNLFLSFSLLICYISLIKLLISYSSNSILASLTGKFFSYICLPTLNSTSFNWISRWSQFVVFPSSFLIRFSWYFINSLTKEIFFYEIWSISLLVKIYNSFDFLISWC